MTKTQIHYSLERPYIIGLAKRQGQTAREVWQLNYRVYRSMRNKSCPGYADAESKPVCRHCDGTGFYIYPGAEKIPCICEATPSVKLPPRGEPFISPKLTALQRHGQSKRRIPSTRELEALLAEEEVPVAQLRRERAIARSAAEVAFHTEAPEPRDPEAFALYR